MIDNIKQYYKKLFEGKSILVLVPHPDDEINLFGNMLDTLTRCVDCQITIAYLTNGDYYGMPIRRLTEAKKAIKILSNNKQVNIVFLGYPESDFSRILNGEQEELTSFNGLKHSYGSIKHPEFHYSVFGRHAKITYNNIEDDIRLLISKISPDYLVANLEDNHPAHMLLSRIVDHILSQDESEIVVLRGYCYETAWSAPRDFYSINPHSCLRGSNTKISDSIWESRIRMPVLSGYKIPMFYNNAIVRALSKHKSQGALGAAKSVVNGDSVYWLCSQPKNQMNYLKILVDDDFVYEYRISNKKCTVKFGIYECLNGVGTILKDYKNLTIRTSNDVSVDNDTLRISMGKRKIVVSIEDREHGLNDEIVFIRTPRIAFCLYDLIALIEQILVRCNILISSHTTGKIYKKVFSNHFFWKYMTNYNR